MESTILSSPVPSALPLHLGVAIGLSLYAETANVELHGTATANAENVPARVRAARPAIKWAVLRRFHSSRSKAGDRSGLRGLTAARIGHTRASVLVKAAKKPSTDVQTKTFSQLPESLSTPSVGVFAGLLVASRQIAAQFRTYGLSVVLRRVHPVAPAQRPEAPTRV
jgi:hypothetical protein